jgi:tight adherence protein B
MEPMSDARNLIALFWVACFGCGVLLFWLCVRSATIGVQRYQAQFSDSARRTLEQMFLFIDTKQLWTINAVVIVALGAAGWLISDNLIIVAACCVIGYFLPRILFAFFKMRRLRTLRVQMPDAIMLVAGGLRAGASLPGALTQMVAEMQPPISQEFDLFLREQRVGVSFEDALESFEKRVPVEEVALLSSALRVSRETGGNLAETLERLAATLREKLSIEGKIRSLTAQGKLQGIVVGLLPIALIAVLFRMEPEAMSPLFHSWYGWATLGFIACMEIVGGLIIRKIVSIDV